MGEVRLAVGFYFTNYQMKIHRVANVFPMMSEEEFEELKTDIAANGLKEPVWLYKGQIIDGRNRYKACTQLKIKPQTREWNGKGSLISFVLSLNLKRRNLTSSQKAAVGLEALPFFEEEAKQRNGGRPWKSQNVDGKADTKKPTQKIEQVAKKNGHLAAAQAAQAVGTNRQYVSDAKKLKEKAPDLFTEVHQGNLAIPDAKLLLKLSEEKRKQAVDLVKTGEAKSTKEAARQIKQAEANAQRLEAAATVSIPDNIIIGDFWTQSGKIADNSLSLIFTDPPYSKEDESQFPKLADFAGRKLARGGSILFYLGHLQLPCAFKAFEGKLRHWWTCACVHAGGKDLMIHYGVRVGWKPMLWFVKEARFDTQNIVTDTVSATTEKEHHDWQQAEDEARYWIEKLCPPDGIVCDPFLGGGTTAAAANHLKRKWVGFEIDPDAALIASGRLESK